MAQSEKDRRDAKERVDHRTKYQQCYHDLMHILTLTWFPFRHRVEFSSNRLNLSCLQRNFEDTRQKLQNILKIAVPVGHKRFSNLINCYKPSLRIEKRQRTKKLSSFTLPYSEIIISLNLSMLDCNIHIPHSVDCWINIVCLVFESVRVNLQPLVGPWGFN